MTELTIPVYLLGSPASAQRGGILVYVFFGGRTGAIFAGNYNVTPVILFFSSDASACGLVVEEGSCPHQWKQ